MSVILDLRNLHLQLGSFQLDVACFTAHGGELIRPPKA